MGGVTAASAVGGLATGSVFAGHADGKAVRVDQVGYPIDGQKIAVVTSSSDLDPTGVSTFEVRDADTGETVHSGDLSEAYDDTSSGHTVKHADFSQEGESENYSDSGCNVVEKTDCPDLGSSSAGGRPGGVRRRQSVASVAW